MIDIFIYNQDKLITYASSDEGLSWRAAHAWLEEKEKNLLQKGKMFDKIEIQLFTVVFTKKSGKQAMPFMEHVCQNFYQAHEFLNDIFARIASGRYKGIWLG